MNRFTTKRLAIVTGCWKRPEVFQMFANSLKKLSHPNLDIVVIVAGSEGETSKQMVESNGFIYIEIPNEPLATKMNATTQLAGQMGCDYVLCVGSDDIITQELLNVYVEYMDFGFDFIGVLDWYFYDLPTKKMIYWGGYRDPVRLGHTCGAGRMISRKLMTEWGWIPWDVKHSTVLDNSMQLKLKLTHCSQRIFSLKEKGVFAFDIKSEVNMTPFAMWDNAIEVADPSLTKKFLKCVE